MDNGRTAAGFADEIMEEPAVDIGAGYFRDNNVAYLRRLSRNAICNRKKARPRVRSVQRVMLFFMYTNSVVEEVKTGNSPR